MTEGQEIKGSHRPPMGPGRAWRGAMPGDGKRFSEFEIPLEGGSPL